MNHWAQWLATIPSTLQRAIARFQRVSFPRGSDATVRAGRLRAALCHARTVRVTYFRVPVAVQTAAQVLCDQPQGLTLATLTAQFGPVRALDVLLADCQPTSVSEHLLLLGWIVPRPATPRHPTRYRMPPEVRAWLPQPLALPDLGSAPQPSAAPVLRVAATLLLAAAEAPVRVRRNGTLRAATVRHLLPRLTPLADAAALCHWTMRLLVECGCLAPHGTAVVLSPAGQRFLTLPNHTQQQQLHAAWVRSPTFDAWLHPLLTTTHGLDLPTLRRRLGTWTAALPVGRRITSATVYDQLAAAFGPLADATTHPYRRVDRVPWQPKRAALIWDAALRSPLAWLGLVAWVDATHCFATPTAQGDRLDPVEPTAVTSAHPLTPSPAQPVTPWSYGDDGTITIPHTALDATVVPLLPAVDWHHANARETTYQVTRRTLARAAHNGYSLDALAALLVRHAGPLPDAWHTLLAAVPTRFQLIHAAVLVADQPAVLQRAAQARRVRRYLDQQLAPGIALVTPEHVAPLLRVMAQHDFAVTVSGDPTIAAPADLSQAECATLLAACRSYRQHDPAAPSAALAQIERRLRAAVPNVLQESTAEPIPTPGPTLERTPASAPVPDVHADTDAATPTSDLPPTRTRTTSRVFSVLLVFLVTLLRWPRAAGRLLPAADQPVSTLNAIAPPPPDESVTPVIPALHADPHAELAHAIARRQTLAMTYTALDGTVSTRTVRPIRLEWHAGCTYLYAYCCLRQAERCFRTDRISALHVVDQRGQRGRGSGRVGHPPRTEEREHAAQLPARPSRPRRTKTGFIAPPSNASGNPVVRIWLAD